MLKVDVSPLLLLHSLVGVLEELKLNESETTLLLIPSTELLQCTLFKTGCFVLWCRRQSCALDLHTYAENINLILLNT